MNVLLGGISLNKFKQFKLKNNHFLSKFNKLETVIH